MENPVIENIRSRRSVKDFENRRVSRDDIEKIVEAGRFAPSALNRQPWKFIVIEDKKIIQEMSRLAAARIRRLYRLVFLLRLFSRELRDERTVRALKKTALSSYDTVFYDAPLVIIVLSDARPGDTTTDAHLASQNMMLAAHSLGIGSCFIGRARAIPRRFVLKRFGLPGYYAVGGYIAFGYPKNASRTAPPRKEDVVKWV